MFPLEQPEKTAEMIRTLINLKELTLNILIKSLITIKIGVCSKFLFEELIFQIKLGQVQVILNTICFN